MTSSGGIAQEKPNMKFSVLALDYDGTIARDGQLDPEVRSAIGEVRSRGIVVVIVTGRTISDLTMVAGGLDFVDAVVGENGAVLAFPQREYQVDRQASTTGVPRRASSPRGRFQPGTMRGGS